MEFIQKLYLEECFFRTRFQIYCPGCGGSRAAVALLQGDLLQSLKCNPVTFLFLMDVLLMTILDIVKIASHGKITCTRIRLVTNIALLVFIVGYFLLRNYLWLAHGIDLLGDFA